MTTITPLALPEVLLITPKRHGDARGWFSETWNRTKLAEAGVTYDFLQDNQAYTAEKNTVRGLHFQHAPYAQAKLVRVLRGAIYDVAVDIRPGSATYGKSVGVELTAEGGEQLLVPRGFAHGYCTLVPDTELIYKVDNVYAPRAEGGLLWCDPALGIDWPIRPEEAVILERVAAAPTLRELGPVDY
jgi:dTDP-4-dehydrorhamnose 3,5-epimerase